jgi:hypothetical protein
VKKEDALSLFHFSLALFYAICEVKANKNGLKLNGPFSFWSMVKMVAYCEETNVHISMEMKEGLSCSLVKASV